MRSGLKAGRMIILPAFMLLFSLCSDAPVIEPEPVGRIVLAEAFSFARCTYCPYTEAALDSLAGEYGDSLAVLIYHLRQLGDTLSPAYVAVRESLYSITSAPTVVFDGINLVQTEDPEQDYQVYRDNIISERNQESGLVMGLDVEVNDNSVDLMLQTIVTDSVDDAPCRVFFVIYEDDVYFKQVGAPDSIFDYVVRDILPDEYGAPITLLYLDSITTTSSFDLSPGWDPDKVGVVAFIQDMASRQVFQAVVMKRIQ